MYTMDSEAARKADTLGGQINELGKYVGQFTQAVDITASTGTKGIALTFQARNGQKARLSLYTEKANGEKIMGFQALSAIMACLSLRGIKQVQGEYTVWNNGTRKEEKKRGAIFPDLCDKPIGLLLETEDYEKQDGTIGTRMVLRCPFQANTELTAGEILDRKTDPEMLEKLVEGLRHRPIKSKSGSAPAPAPRQAGGSGFDDMDDDVPFMDPLKSRAFCLAV